VSLQDETEEFPVGLFHLIMFDNNAIYSMYPRRHVRFEGSVPPGRIEERLLDKSTILQISKLYTKLK
jgi:hypothetical protein